MILNGLLISFYDGTLDRLFLQICGVLASLYSSMTSHLALI